MVREPDSFDEVVAPDESIQAAIDRCREGGSILLKPGTHTMKEGTLLIHKEVHVFGRGLARLQVIGLIGITCMAAVATVDGLIVERTQGPKRDGVQIIGGGLRLQNTTITGSFQNALVLSRGADPVIVGCRSVPSQKGGREGISANANRE